MSKSLNKVQLIGNLGGDPDVRVFDNGDKLVNVSLATTDTWKDKNGERQESTEWHSLRFTRGLADVAENYLRKGSKVYVEGSIKTRSWEDQGERKYRTEIQVRDLLMLDSRTSENTSRTPVQESSGHPVAQDPPPVNKEQIQGDLMDDLPF